MTTRRVTTRGAMFACALAALFVSFFILRPIGSSGPPMRDFESYWSAGRIANAGGDPYSRAIWSVERGIRGVMPERNELLPFVGPPYGLPLWGLFARLPYDLAVRLWGACLALAVATLALGGLVLAGGRRSGGDVVATLVLVAAFGPLTSGVALGQVAIACCGAIVGALLLLRSDRAVAAAAAAALAGLQPNLALALLARMRDRTATLAFACAAALAALAASAARGAQAFPAYVALLREHAGAERFLAIQTTLSSILRGAGASAPVALRSESAVALLVAGATVALVATGRYAPTEATALACAALPAIIPFAHEHDLAIALLPALLVLRRARGGPWACCALAVAVLAVDWLGLAQRPIELPMRTATALAGALAVVLFSRAERRTTAVIPLLVVPLVVAVGLAVAHGHRLGVWPDALPRPFIVSPQLSVAALWHAEQLRAGIGTLDPAWSGLRALSWLGAFGVWIAAAVTLRAHREKPRTIAHRSRVADPAAANHVPSPAGFVRRSPSE